MSQPKKFLLSYDAQYDHAIERVLRETPPKRRSARIRDLIYKGLHAESHEDASGFPLRTAPPAPETAERKTALKKPRYDPQ